MLRSVSTLVLMLVALAMMVTAPTTSDARSLDEINSNCENITYYVETDSEASVVTIGGVTYWKIEGLSNTGGFSAEGLPPTGNPIHMMQIIGLILCSLSTITFFYTPKIFPDRVQIVTK